MVATGHVWLLSIQDVASVTLFYSSLQNEFHNPARRIFFIPLKIHIYLELEAIVQAEFDIEIPKPSGFWRQELYLIKRSHKKAHLPSTVCREYPEPLAPAVYLLKTKSHSKIFPILTSFIAQTCSANYFAMITVPPLP